MNEWMNVSRKYSDGWWQGYYSKLLYFLKYYPRIGLRMGSDRMSKHEYIPVRCVLLASVTTTRCHYPREVYLSLRWYPRSHVEGSEHSTSTRYYFRGCTHCWNIPTPWTYLPLDMPTSRHILLLNGPPIRHAQPTHMTCILF